MPKEPKKTIDLIVKNIEKATVEGLQKASVDIMNALVEAGPAYTGAFSSSWYAVPPDKTPGGPRRESGLYKYTLRNVPKTKFKTTGVYRILNTSPYADQALDLAPYRPPTGPLPERVVNDKRVFTGQRAPGATRGDLGGGNGNTSTAPLDWWVTFGRGGKLDSVSRTGFTTAFKRTFGAARGFK